MHGQGDGDGQQGGEGQPGQGPAGGPGQGFGPRPVGDLNTPETFRPERLRGRVGQGKIVGSYFTRGAQVRGESEAEWAEVARAAEAQAAEALEKTRIPRRMADYVRGYIDSITPERQ
ncbi:MAG: hypothetical protein KF878_26265 [Planctomycetes bacterium]|nr:hypothetical protein [Planctomycetota bacterium]